MFHSRFLDNKTNRLHARCLCIVYRDNKSSFEDLLDKDKSVSIHVKTPGTCPKDVYSSEKRLCTNSKCDF